MQHIQEKFKLRGLKLPNENPKYEILSTTDVIENEINKVAQQSMEIFEGVSLEECQKLLHEFNWDGNRLLEKFYEAESFDEFIKKNDIDLTSEFPPETMITSFIHSNSLFKRCPNKKDDCKKIVKIQFSEVEDIICECGITFCYKCDNILHAPIPCIFIAEWLKQCEAYDEIFANNDVICPFCFAVYECDDFVYQGMLTCTNCDNKFDHHDNQLTKPWVYPEYKMYFAVSDYLDIVFEKKDKLKECGDVKFMTTVCNLIRHYLEKILPIPLFYFFLDKEYLSKHSSISGTVLLFEFSLKDLKSNLADLMMQFSIIFGFSDEMISSTKQVNILDALFAVQQHLEKITKFVTETKGWIFKIPEIQEVHDKINQEIDDADVDMDENAGDEMACDVDMEDSSSSDENGDDNSNDIGEESNDADKKDDKISDESNDVDYLTCEDEDDVEEEFVLV